MPLVGWIILGIGFAGLVALAIWRAKDGGDPLDFHTGEVWSDRPSEPGWTETLGQSKDGTMARSFEVNDDLMTADARAPHNLSSG